MKWMFRRIYLITGIRLEESKKMYRRNEVVCRGPHQDAKSTLLVETKGAVCVFENMTFRRAQSFEPFFGRSNEFALRATV